MPVFSRIWGEEALEALGFGVEVSGQSGSSGLSCCRVFQGLGCFGLAGFGPLSASIVPYAGFRVWGRMQVMTSEP